MIYLLRAGSRIEKFPTSKNLLSRFADSSAPERRLFHIDFEETSFQTVVAALDPGAIYGWDCVELVPRSTDNSSDIDTDSRLSTHLGSSNEFASNRIWPTPRRATVLRAWQRLGMLARLPQLHVPSGNREPNDANSSSAISIDKDGSASLSNYRMPLARRAKDTSSWDPLSSNICVGSSTRRHHSAFLNASSSVSLERLSSTTYKSHSSFLQSIPYHRCLCSFAAEQGPHRSAWSKFAYETGWSQLILIALRQASRLASNVVRLSVQCDSLKNDVYVLLTGPASGRVWQPIVSSLVQIILIPETRTLAGFEQLIDREWVRLGYPFAPDPSDWFDPSISVAYEEGASFGLFLDCVYQLLWQFPVEFAFTEDYLVVLLDTALSRGGGIPPLAIEFACSCEAARSVSTKAKSIMHVHSEADCLFQLGALRSFREWTNVLTAEGLELFVNWSYWWAKNPNPLPVSPSPPTIHVPQTELFPIFRSISDLHIWIHAWFRWIRPLRLTNGGGYAFDAAWLRQALRLAVTKPQALDQPQTSASPYNGWMSDEAISNSKQLCNQTFQNMLNTDPLVKFVLVAMQWEQTVSSD